MVEMIGATEDRTRDRAVPAQHKGRSHEGPMVKKRQSKITKCNNGIQDRGTKWQLCLSKEKTSSRTFRKIVELEIEKQIVRSSTGLQEVGDWTLWRGWPPLKRKKRRPKHSPQKR
jgi:hypothetical protein